MLTNARFIKYGATKIAKLVLPKQLSNYASEVVYQTTRRIMYVLMEGGCTYCTNSVTHVPPCRYATP